MIAGNSAVGQNSGLYSQIKVKNFGKYSKIKFGNTSHSMSIAQLVGEAKEKTKEELDNYNINAAIEWNSFTYMLSLFDNSLQAGNITGFDDVVEKYYLYREKSNGTSLQFIAEVDKDTTKYVDYTCVTDESYRYYVFAVGDTKISSPVITNYQLAEYYGFFFINEETGETYIINYQASGDAKVFNYTYEEFVGNTKFKTYSVADVKYDSGSIGGILSKVGKDSIGKNNVETIKDFKEYVFNKDIKKYYKNRDGSIFDIFITSFDYQPLSLAFESPYIVNISWEEKESVL